MHQVGSPLPIRELRLNAGAGFIVAVCGTMMTMPGCQESLPQKTWTWTKMGIFSNVRLRYSINYQLKVSEMQQMKRMDDGVRLRVQFEDDLWVLNQMIRPLQSGNDGFRRDQSTGTEASGRAKSADRKPMWIVLDAETTEFQPFTDNLRIHGIICEAKMDKGSHHTHAVGPRDEIEISWLGGIPETDQNLLAESLQEGGRGRVAIAVESDEILLFEIAQHGMRQVEIRLHFEVGGKREAKSAEVRKEFLIKVAEQASKAISIEMPVVICGPGMAREQFETHLKATGAGHRILNVATSIGGRSAANEVMREGTADAMLGEFANGQAG